MKRIMPALKLVVGDPLSLTGGAILMLIIAMAAFAPLIATHDPWAIAEEEEGSVLTFDGDNWRLQAALGNLALSGIDSQAERAVVVGREGSAWQREGGRWTAVDTP